MPTVTIREVHKLNHNVRRFTTSKPDGMTFEPGQATEVSIDKEGLREEGRPFTFTSLPENEFLEFTIKIYPSHEGVTDALDDLKAGDRLLISEPFGAITWKGPGVFIAGGAGVTPFIAILRKCANEGIGAGNMLLFSNSKSEDVFMAQELGALCKGNIQLTLTSENHPDYFHGRIDEAFLKERIDDYSQYFYVCGPPPMIEEVTEALKHLGAVRERIITEEA
ncbi:MAG: FAD-binding oxidoreductase [Oceanipulchritudo sp.]